MSAPLELTEEELGILTSFLEGDGGPRDNAERQLLAKLQNAANPDAANPDAGKSRKPSKDFLDVV